MIRPPAPARFAFAVLAFALIGCGDKDDDTATASTGTCAALCTGAGFDGGDEVDFGDNLIECTCSGEGDGVDAGSCATYCEAFGVSAENALLSGEDGFYDKCVCDGTAG